jgi:alginate O-acetyltransferase complex protein AlgJ
MRSADRVAQISQQLSQRSIKLAIVIVPDKSEIYTTELGIRRSIKIKTRKSRFLAHLAGRDIEVLDASMPLNKAKAEGDVFMRDDTHWSPAGSRAVAKMIAASLAEVPIARASVETRTLTTVPFDGDLLSYIPTGVWREIIGPKQQYITTLATEVEISVGLFDEAPIDVSLVGTSFSAKPAWHFEGFLKQYLQADILNFAKEGQGPFKQMEAYLASQDFKATPPKIVIWEIPARYIFMEHTL